MSETGINTFNEKPLHAALKEHFSGPGAEFEKPVQSFIADVMDDGGVIEIQTAGFTKIRRKLQSLLREHRVRLVYPIAEEKWIVRLDAAGERLGRRKSPKRGRWEDVFDELVACPQFVEHPNFTLVIAMIQEEEVRSIDGQRRRRGRDWARMERRLLGVLEERRYSQPSDFLGELPGDLPVPFTTEDLATAMGIARSLAQKVAYCLRRMNAITSVGKRGNAILYEKGTSLLERVQ